MSQNESLIRESLTEEDTCDGVHPGTAQVCVLGEHKGCHQSEHGIHWLDD